MDMSVISMFETRAMLELLEELKRPVTFLKSTFFSNEKTHDTEWVDIDIFKGKRRMAAFVSPIIGGTTVERLGYKTTKYRPVLVAPDMITTAQDAFYRAAGEHIYSSRSATSRMLEQMGKDFAELEALITRREEWMCAEALFKGEITMIGEGVNEKVTFGLGTTHNVTITTDASKWSKTTSNPLKDLRTWRRTIIQDSGVPPNIIVMGSTVVDNFVDNELVKKALDVRRIDRGIIDPSILPDGVTYWGYIKEIACDIYSYDEWYLDDSGTEQPMVPADKLLMGSGRARTDLLYGGIAEPDEGMVYDAVRVPKSWTKPKPSARFVALKSRPLPVPTQIDAFLVAKVV
jgi:hypothetical protein